MAYPLPPTAADVDAVLTAAGESVGSVNTASILAAAMEEWGRRTGWKPFQATATSTRYYTPPRDGMLLLPGYASITSVQTGVTYDSTTGAVIAGTAAVARVGYWPVYWREGDPSSPIVALDFRRGCCGGFESIMITGKVGYSELIPADVWQAWVEQAAARAMASTSATRTKGIAKMSIGSRSLEYATGTPEGWKTSYDTTINLYRRGGVS